MDKYEAAKRKANAARIVKKRNLQVLITHIDKVLASSITEGNVYHAGEVKDLNDARHKIFTVLAGISNRARR